MGGGGATTDRILAAYPHLHPQDVEQAVRYAARFLENEVIITTDTTA